MKLIGRLLAYGLILLVCTSQVNARSIYKWTDADGNVHYGEKPPTKGATELRIRSRGGVEKKDSKPSSSTASPQADPKVQRDKMIKAMEGDRLARQEKRQKQAEKHKKHKKKCARAKDRLRRYRSASSLYKLDDDGNRIILPQSVKQKQIQTLQSDIKKWCK